MSMTYSIGCIDCKKHLWIGQNKHIYRGNEHLDNLENFLNAHISHTLKYNEDINLETFTDSEEIE